jgi:hypothetical protein
MNNEQKLIYIEKSKTLADYLNSLEDSPQQRSVEWYDIRRNNFGGSEIYKILQKRTNLKYADVFAGKFGIGEPFTGNAYTRWGNLFEPVTKTWSEIVLKMDNKILEAPSIPGKFKRQRYSPDGLGIVQLNELIDIILFEFKAPALRLPDNTILPEYVPQIKTGLFTIDIADRCIFVNNCYRKCALEDLKFNDKYDLSFHTKDDQKDNPVFQNKVPYACGIIFFYHTYEEHDKFCKYANELDEIEDLEEKDIETVDYDEIHCIKGDIDLLIHSKNKLIDFGNVSNNTFDRLLYLFDKKRIMAKNSFIVSNKDRINEMPIVKAHNNLKREKPILDMTNIIQNRIAQFPVNCQQRDQYPIGYLPWKLMESNMIFQERDPNWENVIKKPLEIATEILETILASENHKEKFDEIFPKYSEKEKENRKYFTEE